MIKDIDKNKVSVLSLAPKPVDINEGLIECLEEILEWAREGYIVGACVAMEYSDGAIGDTLVPREPARLLAALEIAKREVIDHYFDLRLHVGGVEY